MNGGGFGWMVGDLNEWRWIWMNGGRFGWIAVKLDEWRWIWLNGGRFEWMATSELQQVWMSGNKFEWVMADLYEWTSLDEWRWISGNRFGWVAGDLDEGRNKCGNWMSCRIGPCCMLISLVFINIALTLEWHVDQPCLHQHCIATRVVLQNCRAVWSKIPTSQSCPEAWKEFHKVTSSE